MAELVRPIEFYRDNLYMINKIDTNALLKSYINQLTKIFSEKSIGPIN